MSAEAYDFVWRYGPKSGLKENRLLAMLRLAESSKERTAPFTSEASFRQLAADMGLRDERNAKRIIAGLIDTEHLQVVIHGKGSCPNLYRFGHKGVAVGTTRGVAQQPPHLAISTEVA
jgi:hypothetical protein